MITSYLTAQVHGNSMCLNKIIHDVWDPVTIKKGVDSLENEVCKNESYGWDLHNLTWFISIWWFGGARIFCYQRLYNTEEWVELLIVATSMRTFFFAKKEAERWVCKISGSSRIYSDPNIAFHLFFFWCLKNLTLKESKMYAVSKNSTNHSEIDMLILNHLLVDSCLQFMTKGCY